MRAVPYSLSTVEVLN